MLKKIFKSAITYVLISSAVGCYGSLDLELTGVSVSSTEHNYTVNNENNNEITSNNNPIPTSSTISPKKIERQFEKLVIKENPKPPPPKIRTLDQLRTYDEIKEYFYYFERVDEYYIKKGDYSLPPYFSHKGFMCRNVQATCDWIKLQADFNRPAPIRKGVLEWINDPDNRKICQDRFEKHQSIEKCSLATEIVE